MAERIPQKNKSIVQMNMSDLTGNIHSSKNILIDEKGYIKLSPGAVKLTSADADFDEIGALVKSNGLTYLLSTDTFSIAEVSPGAAFTNATASDSAPTPGVDDDGTYFNGKPVITDGTSAYYRASASTWTQITGGALTGFNASNPTAVSTFEAQSGLLIGNSNKVHLINTSWAIAQTLTLPADYEVTSIASNGLTAYIGTRHAADGEAALFLWNGTGTGNQGVYGVQTFYIFSVVKYRDSVALVNSLGEILQYSGGGFRRLAQLPVYQYDDLDLTATFSNRSIAVDGDLIYLNVSSYCSDAGGRQYLPQMPGGIWCFDPEVGLYHRNAHTKNVLTSDSFDQDAVDTSTDIITAGVTVPVTGTPVYYEEETLALGGLTTGWYYVIKVTSSTLKLATTRGNADDGTAIDILSKGTGSSSFYFVTENDYGDSFTEEDVSTLVLSPLGYDSYGSQRLIYTNSVFDKTDAQTFGLSFVHRDIYNRGYYKTSKIESSEIEDVYNSICVKHKPLKNGDKIIIRAKTIDSNYMPTRSYATSFAGSRATWTSTTTFTTTQDLSNIVDTDGDMVEIIGGQGAGHIAHITDISESSGTYTVTIDEAFAGATNGDYMRFIVDNYFYVGEIDSTIDKGEKTCRFKAQKNKGKFIQFMIEMRGTQVAIEELIINNKVHKPVV